MFDSLFKLPYTHLYDQKPYESIGESISKLFKEAKIDRSKITVKNIPDFPIWLSEPNNVNSELSIHDKKSNNPEFFKNKFLSDILPQYKGYQRFYTDGSKHEFQAGYGIFSNLGYSSNRISDDSSIFTAEL